MRRPPDVSRRSRPRADIPDELSGVGDIKASLKALILILRTWLRIAPTSTPPAERAADEQKLRRQRLAAAVEAEMSAPVTTPLVAARQVTRAIGPDIAIVDEAMAMSSHVRAFLDSPSSRQIFAPAGARSRHAGGGRPIAGLDRQPVVCMVGDGASMYSPQALWTAAHEKLPVTFVVINNREYNILKSFMRSQPSTGRREPTASSRWTSRIRLSTSWRSPAPWAFRPAGSS